MVISGQPDIQVISDDGSVRAMEPEEVAVYEDSIRWNEDTEVEVRVTIRKTGDRVRKRERIWQFWKRLAHR